MAATETSCWTPTNSARAGGEDADLGERTDLAEVHPDVLKAIMHNFSLWNQSVWKSRTDESHCGPPARFQYCKPPPASV